MSSKVPEHDRRIWLPKVIPDFIIAGRYVLIRQIGAGGFGEIYLARDKKHVKREVAVKMENLALINSQLYFEEMMYKQLKNGVGIPQVEYIGKAHGYSCLVMEKLGPSLASLFNLCSRAFSLKTSLMLADQMLSRIWFIHRNGIIHRDIKPDNFLMGVGRQCNTVYLIDFGLATKYIDPLYNKHIPYNEEKKVIGTVRYVSLSVQHGVEPSRRDDLESLGYTLAFFLRGNLPWQGITAATKKQKYEKIMAMKMGTSIEELFEGHPKEFVEYFKYCRGLAFDEQPDYEYLLGLFRDLFWTLDVAYDNIFDWITLRPKWPEGQRKTTPVPKCNNKGFR